MSSIQMVCPHCRTILPIPNPDECEQIHCFKCRAQLFLPEAVLRKPVWYYERNQQKTGPFFLAQLKELVSKGQVLPSDLIGRQGAPRWREAGALFADLFPPAAPPPVPDLATERVNDVPAAEPAPASTTDLAAASATDPPAAEPAPASAPDLAAASATDPPAAEPAPASATLPDIAMTSAADSLIELDDVMKQAAERPGPLSLKGFRVQPERSLTLGEFRILQKLGTGGMGAVYLARQIGLNRPVALKVLPRYQATRPGQVQRFDREVGVLANLDHPNIVRFYGAGEEMGFRYFAMEFVEGLSVAAVRERLGGKLQVGDALHIVRKCAEALHYAHERQIIHRDVKPENLLINGLGHIKITDLGLAKPLDEDLAITASGVGLGTPLFAAPEQTRDARQADQRSDIYALGGVLYQLLTGELPFKESVFVSLFLAKEQGWFPPASRVNRDLPPELDLLLDKMLTRDPQLRFQSCPELIQYLDSLGLTNPYLSFNVWRLGQAAAPPVRASSPSGGKEIFLLHDDVRTILLVQEAIDESGIPSNLSVVGEDPEAARFLRRAGKYTSVARPHLIILGRPLFTVDSQEILAAIKADDQLRALPLVILNPSAGVAEILQAHGLQARLLLTPDDDLKQNLVQLFKTLDGRK
jgi:serine/threonine protein kinase